MPECLHQWTMTNIQFGFVVFEKCFHCNSLETSFSVEDSPILGDKYRKGDCFLEPGGKCSIFSLRFKMQ